jgi:hypothetical protein
MRFAMDVLYVLMIAAYSPVILYRRMVHGRLKADGRQRVAISAQGPLRPCIWIHAVSVGEVTPPARWWFDFVAVSETPSPSRPPPTQVLPSRALYRGECVVFYFPFLICPAS